MIYMDELKEQWAKEYEQLYEIINADEHISAESQIMKKNILHQVIQLETCLLLNVV